MTDHETKKLFNSLTKQQKEEVLQFMRMPKFWRREQMFRETYWWFPMAISILAAIVAVITYLAR